MNSTRDLAILAAGASLVPRRTEHHLHRITEQRAPTDESVRLLKEMEDAVHARVLASLPVKSNAFEGHVVIEHHTFKAEIAAVAVFSLNGKRMEARAEVSEYGDNARRELLVKLHQAVSDKIAAEILCESIRGVQF